MIESSVCSGDEVNTLKPVRGFLSGVQILIVDDEAAICDLLKSECDYYGANCILAKDGKDAVSKIETSEIKKIDLIISDVRMPNLDGVGLLDWIRSKNGHLPPMLMITGYSDISEDEMLKKGAQGVIHKPFDLDDIMGKIKSILKK